MTPQEYLEFTHTTVRPSVVGNADYFRLGLMEEAGEVAGKVKRIIRDDDGVLTESRRAEVLDELGDVLWYWVQYMSARGRDVPERWAQSMFRQDVSFGMASLMWGVDYLDAVVSPASVPEAFVDRPVADMAHLVGSAIDEVVERNVAKLSGRLVRGTISGQGDQR